MTAKNTWTQQKKRERPSLPVGRDICKNVSPYQSGKQNSMQSHQDRQAFGLQRSTRKRHNNEKVCGVVKWWWCVWVGKPNLETTHHLCVDQKCHLTFYTLFSALEFICK